MGLADVQCVSGCSCKPAKLNGRSDHRISVPFPLQFPASAAAWCRLVAVGRRGRNLCCHEQLPCFAESGAVVQHLDRRRAAALDCPASPAQGNAWLASCPQVSQHEQCRIRVTISPEPGQTGEHKVSLEGSRGCGAQALVCSRIRSCVLCKPACIPVLKG